MKLYHGSPKNLTEIKKSQASKGKSPNVPKDELLNAIYLTPDYGFALACAARPKGTTDIDEETKSITFENPKLFEPQKTVYVYTVETENIPKENIIKVDDLQYAIIGIDNIELSDKNTHKAIDVQNYYELKNWKEKIKNEKTRFFDFFK